MPRDAAESQRRRDRSARSSRRGSSTRSRETSRRPRDISRRPAASETTPRQQGARRGRNGSIDGLRALAILAVLFYHLDVTWLPSGHLGVIMFLVLTGYLITSSLLRQLRDGAGAIPRFWARRFLRIWPLAAVVIGLTVLCCIIFNHVLLTKARPDVLPGLALCENVSYILRGVSYFDQIGGPSPLTHLWYLGIDAQFSLVWPILMVLLAAILPSRTATRNVALVLAVASAVAMGVLYNPDAGVTRVYYGTDTRAFAPLLGAWLAYVMPLGKRPARDARPFLEQFRVGIEVVAFLSLAAIVAAMVLVPDTSVLLYRGGMFVAAILSTIVLATLVLPGGLLSALLSLPPLRWLGSRSFGIYLWHYPLIQLFNATANTTPLWKVALAVVLSLVLAELSYQLVEKPLSGKAPAAPAARDRFQEARSPRAHLVAAMLAIAVVGIADGIGLFVIPDETLVPEDAIVSTGDAADHAMNLTKAEQPTQSNPSAADQNIPPADAVLHAPTKEKEAGMYDPVLIGDSVPGDAADYWQAACPDGLLDSYVGRLPQHAAQVLDEYLEQGVVGKIVIIQAFCNMLVTSDQLDHMIRACGDDRIIYLVNTRIPDSFEGQANAQLAAAAERYDNVHLIDWYGYSEGHDDWLYEDGEHLTPTGQPAYISLLVDSIDEDFADAGGTVTRRDASSTEQGTGMSVVVDNTGQGAAATQEESTDESADEEEPELSEGHAPLRILMLGNSLTYYNSMPTMLAELTGAEVVTHTRGGAHLAEQLDPNSQMGASTLEALDEGDWDYIVLQEQSAQPIKTDEKEYLESVTELASKARAGGATPIIYATWPYYDSAERLKKLGMSSSEMGSQLREAFKQAAESSGALVADVEDAFLSAPSQELLYADDGVHPSAIGSRLAAEVIANTIETDQQKR